MRPADRRRPDPDRERLLRVDPRSGDLVEGVMADLPRWLQAPDLLVVNDAAALPASLPARVVRGAAPSGPATAHGNSPSVELRLAGTAPGRNTWWAVLFGEGTWRLPTERRPAPPPVAPGDGLRIAEDFSARVLEVSPLSPRLVRLEFDRPETEFLRALYRHGHPVQYSYLRRDLALWDVQTRYATRPWAMEMPSAGRPLSWRTLDGLRDRGVRVARLTHAAGLSSTGDRELDARLPLPERYEIPAVTVAAIAAARRGGGRVVAAGTTVVRALEANAADHAGRVAAGRFVTDLRVGPGHRLRVVDALLTGVHETGSSHLALMEAFASRRILERALAQAEARGFLQHEFGDSMLVLGPPAPRRAAGRDAGAVLSPAPAG